MTIEELYNNGSPYYKVKITKVNAVKCKYSDLPFRYPCSSDNNSYCYCVFKDKELEVLSAEEFESKYSLIEEVSFEEISNQNDIKVS